MKRDRNNQTFIIPCLLLMLLRPSSNFLYQSSRSQSYRSTAPQCSKHSNYVIVIFPYSLFSMPCVRLILWNWALRCFLMSTKDEQSQESADQDRSPRCLQREAREQTSSTSAVIGSRKSESVWQYAKDELTQSRDCCSCTSIFSRAPEMNAELLRSKKKS